MEEVVQLFNTSVDERKDQIAEVDVLFSGAYESYVCFSKMLDVFFFLSCVQGCILSPSAHNTGLF